MNDLERSDSRSVPIINAGSGADEHPTQALLDIYTLQRTFQFATPQGSPVASRLEGLRRDFPRLKTGLSGKVYGFCGDVGRGRTVRSLAALLALYADVTLVFVAPDQPTLRLGSDLRLQLERRGVRMVELESLESPFDGVPAIERLDALYMTRIQKEHNLVADESAFARIDFSVYKLTPELVRRMKPYAPILHPFPRDQHFGEVPPEIDNDPRAMYFRQARNGMWVRAALLAHIFNVDHQVARYYHDEFGNWDARQTGDAQRADPRPNR
jgi:aspartate carbamoyltransferase catalytic subunit